MISHSTIPVFVVLFVFSILPIFFYLSFSLSLSLSIYFSFLGWRSWVAIDFKLPINISMPLDCQRTMTAEWKKTRIDSPKSSRLFVVFILIWFAGFCMYMDWDYTWTLLSLDLFGTFNTTQHREIWTIHACCTYADRNFNYISTKSTGSSSNVFPNLAWFIFSSHVFSVL